MLDDVALPLVQHLRTDEEHAWITYQVPGLDGAHQQHAGRRPLLITVVGMLADTVSLEALAGLRSRFQAGEPVPFTADIATATTVQSVVIDDLRVTEVAGRPQQYRYVLRLVEHVPPPPPAAPTDVPGLDAEGIFAQTTDLLGELPGLGDLLDLNLVNPVPPLTTLLSGLASSASDVQAALQPLDSLLGP